MFPTGLQCAAKPLWFSKPTVGAALFSLGNPNPRALPGAMIYKPFRLKKNIKPIF
jgi:hypothetical protein